jgi:hypothetical protein
MEFIQRMTGKANFMLEDEDKIEAERAAKIEGYDLVLEDKEIEDLKGP